MCHRLLRAAFLVILILVFAAPAGAQQKPFSREQVQGLVRDGIGDENGARLITQRGIDFQPTEDFLQSLQAAGANPAFLQALRAAKAPQGAAGGAAKPLTQVQVISLVSGEVPTHRVAMLVQDRGIDFDPTTEYFQELRAAGGDDELEAALKGAQVIKPQRVDAVAQAQQAEVRQHTVRAAQFLNKKQYADAVSEYRAAIQLDPENADLHISLGIALGRQGDWDGQIAEDREAVRLNPNNDRAHQFLGAALSRKNDPAGSIAEYREAIRLNPDNEGAHISLGIRLGQMGDWDGAIAEYTEAVRLSPNNYGVHYSLGMAYEHKGNRQAALQEYRTAYELKPSIPTYRQAYERLSSQGN